MKLNNQTFHMSKIYNWFQWTSLLLSMKNKFFYFDNHKAKWLIEIISVPHDFSYNQDWIHSNQHPTVKDVLPRGVSKEKRGWGMGQGTGSLP